MSPKIYIAGRMTGIPLFNFPQFDYWRGHYSEWNFQVFSPADNDRRLLGKAHDWLPTDEDHDGEWKQWTVPNAPGLRKMLGDDLNWIAQNATHIHMMEGWEQSNGAFAEWALAKALKLEFFYET